MDVIIFIEYYSIQVWDSRNINNCLYPLPDPPFNFKDKICCPGNDPGFFFFFRKFVYESIELFYLYILSLHVHKMLIILLCRNDDSGESEKRGVLGPISVQQSVFPLSAAGSGGAALRQTLNELLPLVGVQ